MTTDGNQGVVSRYLEELLNQGNLAVADELLTPDFTIDHAGVPEVLRGPALRGHRTARAARRASTATVVVEAAPGLLRRRTKHQQSARCRTPHCGGCGRAAPDLLRSAGREDPADAWPAQRERDKVWEARRG